MEEREKRTSHLFVLLTPNEAERLKQMARALGVSVSDYVRLCVFGGAAERTREEVGTGEEACGREPKRVGRERR